MTYLGMQIMVEGLALAAFGFIHQLTDRAAAQAAAALRDERRGPPRGLRRALSLKEYYAELSDAEIRERQEFAFEAAVRMRDRFLQQEVWERMGVAGPRGRDRCVDDVARAADVPADAVLQDRAQLQEARACSTPARQRRGCARGSGSSA